MLRLAERRLHYIQNTLLTDEIIRRRCQSLLAFQLSRSAAPAGGGRACSGLMLSGFDGSLKMLLLIALFWMGLFSPHVCFRLETSRTLCAPEPAKRRDGAFPLAVRLKDGDSTHVCVTHAATVRVCCRVWVSCSALCLLTSEQVRLNLQEPEGKRDSSVLMSQPVDKMTAAVFLTTLPGE